MKVVGLHHVQLAMPQHGEAARAFYGGLLKMAELAKPATLAGRGGCWFTSGTAEVHLGVEKDFRPARKAHPAFLVENLAAIESVLTEAQHPYRRDGLLPGFDRIYVEDPFGNRIELLESAR